MQYVIIVLLPLWYILGNSLLRMCQDTMNWVYYNNMNITEIVLNTSWSKSIKLTIFKHNLNFKLFLFWINSSCWYAIKNINVFAPILILLCECFTKHYKQLITQLSQQYLSALQIYIIWTILLLHNVRSQLKGWRT